MANDTNKVVLIILALLLPPVAVFMKKGAGKDLAINIILCILIWFPGIVHAVWLTTK
ncbi:MAG: YqaE/Pmp3 family membrane protein [Gammaproteobacteria bacterium]|nr:YqaE/Pmp3 family membrane protein [Gammaproteobacteria bacterium]